MLKANFLILPECVTQNVKPVLKQFCKKYLLFKDMYANFGGERRKVGGFLPIIGVFHTQEKHGSEYVRKWIPFRSIEIGFEHRLRIQQLIQKGCPFSFVSKFVLNYHGHEISLTDQIALAKSCSLTGRYFEERLGVYCFYTQQKRHLWLVCFQKSLCRNFNTR